MSYLDLYVSRREIYDDTIFCGYLIDVDYVPIESVDLTDFYGALTHRITGCLEPTMSVELDRRWTVTKSQGVINVAVEGLRIECSGIERGFVPPVLLLSFARKGRHGVRIVWGADPFAVEVEDFRVGTQQDLKFGEVA